MLFQSLQEQQELIEQIETKGHTIHSKHDIIETITEEQWTPK